MNPLERSFRARGLALTEIEPGTCVPEAFSDPRAEHLATRRAAGLFDLSFMGLSEFAGEGGCAALQRLQTRNVARLEPGRLCYTLLLRDDGSVFNDATVWRLAEDRFWLFTGRRSDIGWIGEQAPATNRSGEYAVLALQGPASGVILARLAGEACVRALRYFRFAQVRIADLAAAVGRLGFSGELGYELIVPVSDGPALWRALLEAGRGEGLRECGFAAADSLRIESGYVLFGREIDGSADPFELGLERLVEFDGRDFRGARALTQRRFAERARRLCGFEIDHRPAALRARLNLPLARVTSERDSPVFGKRLALGFAGAEAAGPGTAVRLRDGRLARVARLPFYDPARRLPRASPLF
ncbi:MAG: aminomethyl transferase family protein [Betaproteobacteria bacterium]|nr:aminomethyl transferase family protein [Betaproteobacteria bacterium]